MAGVTKADFDKLHEKVDRQGETLANIDGKLDTMIAGKSQGWTILGILGAIGIGIANMIK